METRTACGDQAQTGRAVLFCLLYRLIAGLEDVPVYNHKATWLSEAILRTVMAGVLQIISLKYHQQTKILFVFR
jgi:hypothetical protein